MISFDDFEQMVREETQLLPSYVLEDLNGGVLVDSAAYMHPARVADDLYILGTYSHGGYMGNQIVLYYGSFLAALGGNDPERMQMQVRETLRHEFLHHMETRAGLYWEGTLVEEDVNRMMKYFMRHGMKPENTPED